MVELQKGSDCFFSRNYLSTFTGVISSVITKANSVAQKSIEYTAVVLTDWSRGVDYTTQWISEYSSCSSQVKETAGRVKGAVDRFNLFGVFCEMVSSGKALLANPIESFGDAIDSVGAYVGSTVDFIGRLDGFKLVSLGVAKPVFEGVGAFADSSVGLNGIKNALKGAELNRSLASSMISVAKNVALVVASVLSGISACFTSFAAGFTQIPLYILIAATACLALKIVDCFYDKLVLTSSFEAISRA